MGIFSKFVKTGLHIASTPLDVVKDVATLGGVNTDKDEPYTLTKLKKILKDTEEIGEEIDDL